jgi:hypothetical protein
MGGLSGRLVANLKIHGPQTHTHGRSSLPSNNCVAIMDVSRPTFSLSPLYEDAGRMTLSSFESACEWQHGTRDLSQALSRPAIFEKYHRVSWSDAAQVGLRCRGPLGSPRQSPVDGRRGSVDRETRLLFACPSTLRMTQNREWSDWLAPLDFWAGAGEEAEVQFMLFSTGRHPSTGHHSPLYPLLNMRFASTFSYSVHPFLQGEAVNRDVADS